MAVHGAHKTIREVVAAWQGVTLGPTHFGATAYRLGKREIGHIHGDAVVDIPFPMYVRDQLVEKGDAEPHLYLPGTGWVTVRLQSAEDVEKALRLLRLNLTILA